MKVLVTGGTGFVGSWVVSRLLEEGHRVTVLARDPRKVPGFLNDPQVDFVEGTMGSPAWMRGALNGKDACIHIALVWGDKAGDMARLDTLPAIDLFEMAADSGVRHLIYTSSVAVFDEPFEVFDDDRAARPARYYGSTKAAVEVYLVAVAATRGIRANAIRPGYTFGDPVVPGAPTQKMPELPRIVGQALRNEPIHVTRHDGLQFIWAGDLARVFAAVLASSVDRQFFTALSPDFLTWERIAGWAVEITHSSSEIVVEDVGLPPPIPHYDVSAIDKAFGLRFSAEAHLRAHLGYLAAADNRAAGR